MMHSLGEFFLQEKHMKVLLVGINAKFIHSNLAIRYLKAYAKDLDYNCTLKEFSINDSMERILEELILEKPDIIGFSCYIWNITLINQLTRLIRIAAPDIEILFGGPEVSYDGKSYLEENEGDYVISGEGEETYREFIEKKLEGRSLKGTAGIIIKAENDISTSSERKLMDFNKTVFPYEDEDILDNKIIYYEASRGCPFNCKYCLSSTSHGVRFLEMNRVKKELQFLMDKGVSLVKFVDRTFNCNPEYSMELWEFLIKADTVTIFHFEISADILYPVEMELLKTAPKNRLQFEVGVQTTNSDVLKNINRYVEFGTIKNNVLTVRSFNNIKQHLDLIAGLPGENLESFKQSFNDVYSLAPEEIQLGFLKLLKGSSMREEAVKWGIEYSPFPPYEVLKTKDISFGDLSFLKKIEKMVDKYYNSNKFNSILKYLVNKFDTPFDFYYALSSFYNLKGYFGRNISSVEYYKVFLEFSKEYLEEDNRILNELVKYEYLKHNKKRWLPDFLERFLLNKEEDKKLKSSLMAHGKELSKNAHIEMFKIDIFLYEKTGEIRNTDYLVIFDENSSEII
jgi:radical SAM superfamily enzyme YgiQ (UPF0313 family)